MRRRALAAGKGSLSRFGFEMHLGLLLSSFLIWLSTPALAADSTPIDFGADYYSRDLTHNTVKGKGNAWVKQKHTHLWADEIEVDLNANKATATGNVHVIDKGTEIWSRFATYHLSGKEALLEEATISMGSMVIQGATVRKLDETHFDIENGTYSNCNVDLERSADVGQCDFDWKLSGAFLSIEMGGYATVRDALLYIKGLPVVYIPYAVLPVKTLRQSGILPPYAVYYGGVGSGVVVPLFLAISPWQDLTLLPTYFTKDKRSELYVRGDYRYIYSPEKKGSLTWATTSRRFNTDLASPDRRPLEENTTLGFVGEWMVNANNLYTFGPRSVSRQVLHLVSHPYWSTLYVDYPPEASLGYLRSMLNFSTSDDNYLFTALAQHQQSLLISEDSNADGGAVTKVPELFFGRTASLFLGKYVSYDYKLRLSNFYRAGRSYDNVPATLATAGPHNDSDEFDSNDYLRTGRRLTVEPEVIANIPLSEGLQLTPTVRAGSYFYQFNTPSTQLVSRHYVETEIPFSLYLSRRFSTPIAGLSQMSHVFQPRVVFASNLYNDGSDADPSFQIRYPFFYDDGTLSNPRFDLLDKLTPHQYFRFELINRFRRKSEAGISRFFLLKLSQQYNLRQYASDPRYARRLGPLEILSELEVWRFRAQLQGTYQLERNIDYRESEWSGSLNYRSPDGDNITSSVLLRQKRERENTEQTFTLSGRKVLPLFFDLSGNLEYSAKRGEMVGYAVGFHFASKPRSCWQLDLTTGRDAYKRPFASVRFHLLFGTPSGYPL